MKSLAIATTLGAAVFALSACDARQTEEGELPEVEVQGGNMPEYDVDTADVEVGTTTKTVEVPTVDVEPADASAPEAAE